MLLSTSPFLFFLGLEPSKVGRLVITSRAFTKKRRSGHSRLSVF